MHRLKIKSLFADTTTRSNNSNLACCTNKSLLVMEREAESWFCEDSVASAKLSVVESHDDTLFNFGIEVTQVDSKEPILSDEETEVDKLDKIMNIVNESDDDEERPDGEVSFSLSLLEANAQAQRESGLEGQTKDNQVIEECTEVEVTDFFTWKGSQDESVGNVEEEKAPSASNMVPNERKEPTVSKEEDVGSDLTSIFMWDKNTLGNDESEDKNKDYQAAIELSLERLSEEKPPEQKDSEGEAAPPIAHSEGSASPGERETAIEVIVLQADCKAAKGYQAEHLNTSNKSVLTEQSYKKEENIETTEYSEAYLKGEESVVLEANRKAVNGHEAEHADTSSRSVLTEQSSTKEDNVEREESIEELVLEADCKSANGHEAEHNDASSKSVLAGQSKTKEENVEMIEYTEANLKREEAIEEIVLEFDYKAANGHAVRHLDTSSKSVLAEVSKKKDEGIEMAEYSEANETCDSQSKVQGALSYETDEPIEASRYGDFIKGLFVQNKSESEIGVGDKYVIPEAASSESELNGSDKYATTSDAGNSEAADDGDDVSGAASNLTKDLSKSYYGTTADADASLDKVISSERGSHSFEGTMESSAMGTDFQSTFGDTILDSYEGTMESTLDGNESSFYDGTAATLTSYDIVDSSFSDDFDDPLKMFDFAGCMTATCDDENASLSGDRKSKKKKSAQNEQSNPMSNGSFAGCMTATCDDENAYLSSDRRVREEKVCSKRTV